jgi:signal transduction histidine kinase
LLYLQTNGVANRLLNNPTHQIMNLINALAAVPALKEVPINQLQWILDNGECREYATGDFIFSKGDPIDHLIILIEGSFSLKIEQNGEYKTIADIEEGNISGSLPYSRAVEAGGFGVAQQPSKLITLHKKLFREMIRDHHALTTALVHTMTTRVREFTKTQQQQEKMMSLGKLSAGLAHELNNPASAMVRSAKELKKHLAAAPEKFKRVISIRMTDEQVDAVNEMLFSKLKSVGERLSITELADQEDRIAEWLEEHGLEDGYEYATTLAEFGIDDENLETVALHVEEQDIPAVVDWIQNVIVTENLVSEMEVSAERISDLVSSIKSYTHMDRGTEMEPVDVREGIENTLKMLHHKAKQKRIDVVMNVAENLPEINGMAGSLNQVWTNIIDNAIDAMADEGQLTISIEQHGDRLMVCIQDDGVGIPEEIQSKVFDPFFTTKKIGEGTGMGLEIVSRIIRNHRGEIKLQSVPGNTKFVFYFPIDS